MTPATTPTFKTSPVTGRPKWTEALVYAADAAGFFGDDDRYELIDGELYEMPPPDPIHEWAIRRIVRMLKAAIQATPDIRAEIEKGTPAGLGESDVPVPDIMLMRVDDNDYKGGHPGANDIYLVIEVANSKPSRERNQKKGRYAAFGLADYWVIDLKKREIIIHRQPNSQTGDYDTTTVIAEEEDITLAMLPDVTLDVAALKADLFDSCG